MSFNAIDPALALLLTSEDMERQGSETAAIICLIGLSVALVLAVLLV